MRIELSTPSDTIVLLDDRIDTSGDAWIRQDGVKGLYGATKPREGGEQRPQQSGSYWPSRLTAESRTITLDCVASCESSIKAAMLIDRINALAYQPVSVIVKDATGRRTLSGWVADSPEQTMLLTLDAFTFSLIIYCPDPLRYGDTVAFETADNSINVSNYGNEASWPVVETDNVSSFLMELGGQQVAWNGTASPLKLDFRDMLPSQGTVMIDDAFLIPPGESKINVSYAGSGLRMLVRPAWR